MMIEIEIMRSGCVSDRLGRLQQPYGDPAPSDAETKGIAFDKRRVGVGARDSRWRTYNRPAAFLLIRGCSVMVAQVALRGTRHGSTPCSRSKCFRVVSVNDSTPEESLLGFVTTYPCPGEIEISKGVTI